MLAQTNLVTFDITDSINVKVRLEGETDMASIEPTLSLGRGRRVHEASFLRASFDLFGTDHRVGHELRLVVDPIFRIVSRRSQIPLLLCALNDFIESVPDEPQTLEHVELLLGSDIQQIFYGEFL